MSTLIDNAGGPSKRRVKSKRAVQLDPDEEELKLTESLFGAGSQALRIAKRSRHEDLGLDLGEQDDLGQQNDFESADEEDLGDDELFMLDTGVADRRSDIDSSRSADDSDTSEDSEEEDQIPVKNEKVKARNEAKIATNRESRKPVWADPSSDLLSITLAGAEAVQQNGGRAGTNKLRKLRETEDEVTISGAEYERRLRKTFEQLHPRPSWASVSARAGASSAVASIGDLLSSDVGLVSRVTGDTRRVKRHSLPPQRLDLQRLRNANEQQGRSDLPSIETLSFHPGTRAHIMMTTAKDRRVRLFNIDGKDNPLLEAVHVPDMPLVNAQFHPSGSSILLSGPRPFLYVHDLYTGTTTKSMPWRAFGGSDDEGAQERDFSRAAFAPFVSSDSRSTGRHLALGGRRGAIYLMDWGANAGGGSSAGGSLIGSVRMNAPLAGMCWDPIEERRLVSLSTQGTLHVWDIRQMRCEVQRTDAGLFAPCSLRATPDGEWWSVGSDGGIVNIYGRKAALEGKGGDALQPHKTLNNLVTTTTSMSFNGTGEILAYASSKKTDALKAVHIPSFGVFENWPTSETPLGRVTSLDFSSDSKYLAIGNHRGKVLLYSLQHYSR
jgi:U3 small nucleolar RNA-associated protein 18